MATAPRFHRSASLTREEFNRATAMFDDMDRNHDGVVDIIEFQHVMETVASRSGRAYSFENVRRMFMEADKNSDGYIDYDEWMAVQKLQKSRRLGLDTASQRSSASLNSPRSPENARGVGTTSVDAVSPAFQVSSKAALRELLASLCHNGAAEAGVVDADLAAEAEWLLTASIEAEISRTQAEEAEEHADGTLPNARDRELRDRSIELANVLNSARGISSVGTAVIHPAGGGSLGRVAAPPDDDEDMPTPLLTGVSLSAISAPFEIVVSQMQFTGLTAGFVSDMAREWGDDWPPFALEWSYYLSWTDALNVDLAGLNELLVMLPNYSQVLSITRKLESVPFSTVFMWLALIVPLVLAFVVILSQKPLVAVVWISVLMVGMMLMITAFVGQILIRADRLALLNLTLHPDAFQVFLVAGVTCVAAFLLRHALVSYWSLRTELMKAKFKMRLAAERAKNKDVASLQESLLGHLPEKDGPRSPLVVCRSAMLSLFCLVVYLVRPVSNYIASSLRGTRAVVPQSSAGDQQSIWGAALFTEEVGLLSLLFAVLFGTHALLCLCRTGRYILSEIRAMLNRFLLAIVLLLLSLLYTPVTRQLLSVFICVQKRCPPGSWYPKQAHSWDSAFLQDATFDARSRGECEPCRFEVYHSPAADVASPNASASVVMTFGDTCPAFPTACGGEELWVLREDNTFACDGSIGFYQVASTIMLLSFTCVVPYLFYTLITHHTRILRNIEIDPKRLAEVATAAPAPLWQKVLFCRFTQGLSQADVAWDYRVLKTRNRAKTLYEHFEYPYRYFRLVLLVHRLLLVCVSLFLSRGAHPVIGLSATIALHAIFFFVSVTQSPYFNPLSDSLSSAAAFAQTSNPILLLLAYYGTLDGLPSSANIAIILVVNLGIPLVCLIIGIMLWCKKRDELNQMVGKLEGSMPMDKLEKTTRDIKKNDRALEQDTSQTIASSFMVMAFGAFAAFTFIFSSYIFVAGQGDVVQATPADLGETYLTIQNRPRCQIGAELANVEFVFTGDWDGFTSRCCCRDQSWDPSLQNISLGTAANLSRPTGEMELWTCPDLSPTNASSPSGLLHKLRQREEHDADGTILRSGLHMRPFCSPHFNPGLGLPTYNDDLLTFVVRYANGSIAGTDLW